jgi:hypothetical protein
MQLARTLTLAAAALLALGDTACASIVRSSRAELLITNAPAGLQVYDDGGNSLPLEAVGDGNAMTRLGYNSKKLTLQVGGINTTIDLYTRVSIGYVICDVILDVFPLLIDWATSKWNNYESVDARAALATASLTPAGDPWKGRQQPPQPTPINDQWKPAPTQASEPRPPANPPPSQRTAIVSSGKLAVLDFKSYTTLLKPEDVRYFTDVVRGATLKASPSLEVMTRENLLVLLQATGKDASNCEGECEVDTGRRIGADAVITGEILKVGTHFKLSLRLHETHDGRLLSTAVASGSSIDELDDGAQKAALDLISPAH